MPRKNTKNKVASGKKKKTIPSKKVVKKLISRPLPKTKCCTNVNKDGSAFQIPIGYMDLAGTKPLRDLTPITNIYNYYDKTPYYIPNVPTRPVIVPSVEPSVIEIPVVPSVEPSLEPKVASLEPKVASLEEPSASIPKFKQDYNSKEYLLNKLAQLSFERKKASGMVDEEYRLENELALISSYKDRSKTFLKNKIQEEKKALKKLK